MRGDEQAILLIGPLFEDHPYPERLKPPEAALATHAHPFDREDIVGEPDRLALPRATVIEAEDEIDDGDVEAEKAHHRPGADRDKTDADTEADQTEKPHQQIEVA